MCPLRVWAIIVLFCASAAAQCSNPNATSATFFPNPNPDPFPLTIEACPSNYPNCGQESIVPSYPPGTVIYQPISQTVLFLNPRNQARLVFGSLGDSLFQACDGVFPDQIGQVTFTNANAPQQWLTTIQINSSTGVMNISEGARATVINADGGCPGTCFWDNITYSKTYQYNVATGAYTINFLADRDSAYIDPNTGIDTEAIAHIQGTASGTWPIGCEVKVAPVLYQFQSPWGSLPLATSNFTIGQKGCALSALTMAINFAAPPGETLIDPGVANGFMEVTDTDFEGISVNWGPATRDMGRELFGTKLRFDNLGGFVDTVQSESAAQQKLDSQLCAPQPHPVVVGVVGSDGTFPGHFVLVTGKTGNTYTIADPGHPDRLTLDDPSYGGQFSTRGVVRDPPGDVSELDLAVGNAADLMVTDPSGNRTGFDTLSEKPLQNIPHSAYFRDALTDDLTGAPASGTAHFVQVYQPPQGSYSLTVSGLFLQTYVLSIRVFSQDGTSQTAVDVTGVAGVGSSSTFQVQLSSTPGSASTVARIASFQSTFADISNSLALGLIGNAGIANALTRKIEAAASAAAEHETDDAKEALNAFRHQVIAQMGQHITAVAPQVLLEDVASLISQLP